MGCCNSSDSYEKVSTQRRRLSVGNVKEGGGELDADATEEDRGLINQLAEKDITEMMNKSEGRKLSIGSCEDDCKISFGEKKIVGKGDELSPERNLLGYTCRKGLKPESPNQDSWFILKVCDQVSVYGVFDGHGQKGHDVSNFVKDTLPKLMIKDQRWNTDDTCAMMKDAFIKTQSLACIADRMRKFNAQMSGTTASVVLHDHKKNKLTVAHVADSTVVIGRFKDKDKRSKDDMEGIALSRDHKPDLKDERARIEKNGGRVVFDGYANHRIYAKGARYPGLNMSRCIGDIMGHQDCGITAEPEVSEVPIKEEDHVLLVCSDGVWEFIQPTDAVKMVSNFAPADAMKAAEALAKEAWDRWIEEEGGQVVDDITVLVVYLNQAPAL